eukprot:CAMPEP_0201522294 /NCGR_PEP_ID=MMETSP0161_2-20130828/16783_1 /ASSEMBLY_ACC=CAM_ASM_000251 /TAXON_ID=180227 /ORGANISM="Neoparamoeba aestuarina, Strain SoJaBio B1-5/56/2" /LENGTH=132 /DNA_ID=CAMNT_0047921093 /DNA_START=6 /DNA_END=404 /DNA_ORIENTATION=+
MNKFKVFELARGFRGRSKNCWVLSRNRVEKALQHQYSDRRVKKRVMRATWIQQINAATRQAGLPYSRFMGALAQTDIRLDRRTLAELAMSEPYSFRAVVDVVKENEHHLVEDFVREKDLSVTVTKPEPHLLV